VCEAGTYSEKDKKSTKCLACPTGYWSLEKSGPGDCTLCAEGYFKNPANKKCEKCTGANTNDAGNENPTCTKCLSGYHKSNGECVLCPVGYDHEDAASTECNACSITYYSVVESGTKVCKPCPVGYKRAQGTNVCSECAENYIKINGECKTCPLGTHFVGEKCVSCSDGACGSDWRYDSSEVGYYVKSSFVQYAETNDWFSKDNELFERAKCKTCCKVLFVSDYNFQTQRRFTKQDDIDGFIRYTMDMEFDHISGLREPHTYDPNGFYNEINGHQQNVLLRPLQDENDLQFFEFGEYNMYNSYRLPKRVHDIQGGAKAGSSLIIYMNKWGREDGNGVKNQQFTYVHNYKDLTYYDRKLQMEIGYYDLLKREVSWVNQPLHFFLPNSSTSDLLCYSADDVQWNDRVFKSGDAERLIPILHDEEIIRRKEEELVQLRGSLKTLEPAYQIIARKCEVDDPKQMFVPVFA